ncbi:MAG: hypothetical protein ACYDAN_05440 [Candidatus Limnocylindrales bacterium]
MTTREQVASALAAVSAFLSGKPEKGADEDPAAARTRAAEAEYAARRTLEATAELEIHKQVLAAMIEVAKGSIERSRDSAKFVQTSAAALATVYTTVLALSFSVTSNPLPPRGFIPTIFLGLATALATAYLAFIKRPADVQLPLPTSDFRGNARRNVDGLIVWTTSSVQQRAPFLRAAVVSLLFGVLSLPVAVISSPSLDGIAAAGTASPSPAPSTSVPAAASPTPSWPPQPNGSPDAYSIELYKAQLAAHVAASTAAAPPARRSPDWLAEVVAWLVAAVGFYLVAREAGRRPSGDRASSATAGRQRDGS